MTKDPMLQSQHEQADAHASTWTDEGRFGRSAAAKAAGTTELDRLAGLLAKLPGLGPRSAKRALLHLVKQRASLLDPLINSLTTVRDTIMECKVCGNLDTTSPCHICTDERRSDHLLVVVKDVGDLWALERSQAPRMRYHVLGGLLSPLDGVGPDKLRLASLARRVAEHDVKEVIIALDATVEGQSTAHYITDLLAASDVRISRLAQGVPVGGELDYLDDGTLLTALQQRISLT